ncbi:GNAT family N-acetyltransferase [Paenibacillus yanchengensis]|uniref:GNAT family N-acetyltransferase n=1 Tax=Paenibacillus yanchengensis TaxID=2035833 RepID=A0ABW4YR03_9BACL
MKYTGDKSFASIIEAKEFLKAYDQYEKYNVGRLAVINKTENRFIGWCGLKYSQNVNEYDIGFRFFRKYWNKGYATETSKACIDFGFRKLGLNKIIGRAMKENIASIKVLEKIGLIYMKDFDFDRHSGVIYEITKNKYEQTIANR